MNIWKDYGSLFQATCYFLQIPDFFHLYSRGLFVGGPATKFSLADPIPYELKYIISLAKSKLI